MDEFSLIMSQRWEIIQAHLETFAVYVRQNASILTNRVVLSAETYWRGDFANRLHEKLQDFWDIILDIYDEIRWRIETFSIFGIYNRIVCFITSEVNRTSLYIGCVGFAVGGLFGLYMGKAFRHAGSIGPHMRAVVCTKYRGLDGVSISENVPAPTVVAPDEVLVQVKASTVDLIDLLVCTGYAHVLRNHLNLHKPYVPNDGTLILGHEGSGVIVEMGHRVKRFDIGDDVWFALPEWSVQGSIAEYVVLKETSAVSKKPISVSFEGAATLPLAAMATWDALVNKAGLGPAASKGKRVLVQGAGSACGCLAVQMLKSWGAHVTAISSLRALQVVQMIGADAVYVGGCGDGDGPLGGLSGELNDVPFDVIVFTHESSSMPPVGRQRNHSGLFVSTLPPPLASDDLGFLLRSAYGMWLTLTACCWKSESWSNVPFRWEVLDEVSRLVDSGDVQPVMDKSYSFNDAELAFQYAAGGDPVGKTVIRFSTDVGM